MSTHSASANRQRAGGGGQQSAPRTGARGGTLGRPRNEAVNRARQQYQQAEKERAAREREQHQAEREWQRLYTQRDAAERAHETARATEEQLRVARQRAEGPLGRLQGAAARQQAIQQHERAVNDLIEKSTRAEALREQADAAYSRLGDAQYRAIRAGEAAAKARSARDYAESNARNATRANGRGGFSSRGPGDYLNNARDAFDRANAQYQHASARATQLRAAYDAEFARAGYVRARPLPGGREDRLYRVSSRAAFIRDNAFVAAERTRAELTRLQDLVREQRRAQSKRGA